MRTIFSLYGVFRELKKNTYLTLVLFACLNNFAFAAPDSSLPTEVCSAIGATASAAKEFRTSCNEKDTNAIFSDLNGDGIKELVFSFGGGSCGNQFYVFSLKPNTKKWSQLGNWCGCNDGVVKIQETRVNGYAILKTCGVNGIFKGKEYVGVRQ